MKKKIVGLLFVAALAAAGAGLLIALRTPFAGAHVPLLSGIVVAGFFCACAGIAEDVL